MNKNIKTIQNDDDDDTAISPYKNALYKNTLLLRTISNLTSADY